MSIIDKKDQILNLLGLATRARKIKTGEEIVISEMRRGNVKLVILSEDAAANVTKTIKNKCATYHVTLLTFATRFELGYAIGKESRVVLGITDIGFSKKLKTMIHDFHEE
ncbi:MULTISPECIES: ribosomal L7Ae/L30e/S12e/Gadd45 family protein [unclassified Mammaliicoccus]|uniref:ribosomal L7Ae/L30e/S12e/Gadd45 family protein n=1 Tax=unclassified Mammaliicoccus TaxID=2803851 RepID=UPI001EFAFFF4|nr:MULTISPECIES: ribosomal L7Ae/L30e/S12e/Gadd45 family protein [unclassified Mammaliicoccus]